MRIAFDKALEDLNMDLVNMAGMAENAIEKSITALKKQDIILAKQVIQGDNAVDEMERRIEGKCLKLILQQQPVAKDLIFISTALKMITDIERICDQAEDIAEITLRFEGLKYIKEPVHIEQMSEIASDMVRKSIDAHVKHDIELAKTVIDMDDEVDSLFIVVKNELIDLAIQNKENADQVIDFLMIAKYLERIGDHAVNIAEWVIFSVTGEHKNEKIL